MINLPKIIAEECAANQAPDPSCADARCNDPAFAAANPLLCPGAQSIEIRPGFEIICESATLQFTTWLKSGDGQVQLTSGLTYGTSDASILMIDPQTGAASASGDGIATVSVVWQGLVAQAQITVLSGSADCCASVEVDMAIVEDNSQSMSQTFATTSTPTGPFNKTKGQLAREFANLVRGTGSYVKDKLSVSWFNETSATPGALGSTSAALFAALQSFPQFVLDKKTSLPAGFNEALTALGFDGSQSSPGSGSSLQRVIFLISDGASRPALSNAQVSSLVADADAFKATGGIVFCIGIRAATDGFTLLQRLATNGFFLNVLGSQIESLATINQWILALVCSFCGGTRPADDYSSCETPQIGPQVPDPFPLPDIESGDTGGGGGGTGPKLPKPVFNPASGTSGVDFTVALSVPNHPNARIRFTLSEDGSGWPLDPSFIFPSDPNTGLDYDGGNVPVQALAVGAAWKSVYLKAVARETGFTDSDVATATYPSGQSNNTAQIVINDAPNGAVAKATTYPSVKYVTGVTGHITKVTCKLIGFDHTWPADVWVLLVSPAGTAVLVMAKAGGGNTVSGIDLTFDDAAGGSLPQLTILSTGTYKPTSYLALASPPFPNPAPVGNFHGALSAFIGEIPNGEWQLFVIDALPLNTGHIVGGWTLTITAA